MLSPLSSIGELSKSKFKSASSVRKDSPGSLLCSVAVSSLVFSIEGAEAGGVPAMYKQLVCLSRGVFLA